MAYLLAAGGGALGALARWAVAEALPRSPGGWPWATLSVNLAGCLLIGVLLAAWADRRQDWVQPFVGVGLLGGFTTWSAFAVETLQLARSGAELAAVCYVLASVVGGVLAVAAGARLGGSVRGEGPA